MEMDMAKKLKFLNSSFIMILTLAAPFATYAMEPEEEDHKAVAKKAAPASRRFLYTYLGVALELDMPILEAIYYSAPLRQFERFLNGKLIYKPNTQNDVGKIELRIAYLPNPLDGEFDLSKCGDVGKYLSIKTGYCKGIKPENENKVEIWFAPHFLIEKNLAGSASHFKDIMGSWNARTAPMGTFFTWGWWYNLGWYDYATNFNWDAYNNVENNLSKMFLMASSQGKGLPLHPTLQHFSKFFMSFLTPQATGP